MQPLLCKSSLELFQDKPPVSEFKTRSAFQSHPPCLFNAITHTNLSSYSAVPEDFNFLPFKDEPINVTIPAGSTSVELPPITIIEDTIPSISEILEVVVMEGRNVFVVKPVGTVTILDLDYSKGKTM